MLVLGIVGLACRLLFVLSVVAVGPGGLSKEKVFASGGALTG